MSLCCQSRSNKPPARDGILNQLGIDGHCRCSYLLCVQLLSSQLIAAILNSLSTRPTTSAQPIRQAGHELATYELPRRRIGKTVGRAQAQVRGAHGHEQPFAVGVAADRGIELRHHVLLQDLPRRTRAQSQQFAALCSQRDKLCWCRVV